METKVCTTCGEEKTFDMFGKQKGGKEGLKPRCKECEKQYKKQYYIENKEHVSNHCRQYAKDNNIAIAKHHKQYQKDNKEHIAKERKQYVKDNKENMNQWREDNKKILSEKKRQYRQDNKESISAYAKQYQKKHLVECCIRNQKRIARKRSLPFALATKQWEQIKLYFNNTCCYCDKSLSLAQEHFIPLSKGGEYTTNNIIPSCLSCNSSKNDKDFFTWYPKYEHYSKKREKKILEFLNYKNGIQQLALTF